MQKAEAATIVDIVGTAVVSANTQQEEQVLYALSECLVAGGGWPASGVAGVMRVDIGFCVFGHVIFPGSVAPAGLARISRTTETPCHVRCRCRRGQLERSRRSRAGTVAVQDR